MTFNRVKEEYEASNHYYIFKVGNVLEEYEGDELLSTIKYEISYYTEIKNGISMKFVRLIITDNDFGSVDNYSLYLFIGSDSVILFSIEAQGTAVRSLYKKI